MKRLNIVDVNTRWGYRSFELWHGDITELDFVTDLLVISAIGTDLFPVKGTVIGALFETLGISVERLRAAPDLDFIQPLSTWVSRKTTSPRIGRIMCVQIPPGGLEVDRTVRRAFFALPILEAHGLNLDTVCLPVLGTGGHGLDAENLVGPILSGALWAIRTVGSVRRVCFVEIKEERAVRMSRAMDDVLGRVSIALAKGELVDAIRSEAENLLQQLEEIDQGSGAGQVITDLRDAIFSDSRSVEVGIAARRLAEHVLAGILSPEDKKKHLYARINLLSKEPVAPWIISYLNLLRVFGNEAAHHKSEHQYPAAIVGDDLTLCLFATQRVLDFWITWLRDASVLPNKSA